MRGSESNRIKRSIIECGKLMVSGFQVIGCDFEGLANLEHRIQRRRFRRDAYDMQELYAAPTATNGPFHQPSAVPAR